MKEYADLELVGYLFNTCYGGFSFSDEFQGAYNERRKQAGLEPIELSYYGTNEERSDPMIVQLYQEFGSKKASGHCSRLSLYWVPKDLLDYVDKHEYDGTESVGVDSSQIYTKLLKDFMEKYENDKTITLEELYKQYTNIKAKIARHREFLQNVYYKKKNSHMIDNKFPNDPDSDGEL